MKILPISRNTKTNQIEAKQQTKTNKPNTSYLNNIKTEQTNFKGYENIKP